MCYGSAHEVTDGRLCGDPVSEHSLTANEHFSHAIGFDYGPASSTVQAELLNGFTHSLKVACAHRLETQIAYIVDDLTPEAREILVSIAGMIEASA